MMDQIEQARREAEAETRKEIALTLFSRGEDVYEIAEIVRANPNTVREWVGLRKKFAYRDEWHLRSPEARANAIRCCRRISRLSIPSQGAGLRCRQKDR